MPAKIFSVKNRATGKVERLVKAETRGQVNKHLVSSVEIESVGAVDIVDLMGSGTLRVEDATQVPDDGSGAAGPDEGHGDQNDDGAGTPAAKE